MSFAPQRRALFRHPNLQKWSEPLVFLTFWLRNVLRATTACTFSTSQLPKVVRSWCFAHFDFEMCFAPQWRALFRHRNCQKWSDAEVFCIFSLGNVLRATTACTFSTSQLPKAVRRWGVLYIFTWKCASLYNGVQFFISHLASWLRTRRFSEPTFRPSGASNHWKNTVFRDFPTFSRICIFFLLTLSLLIFSLLIFLLASALLCFSSVHIVGSLTSKLPSMINICPKKIPWSDVEDTPTQRLRPRTFILNLAAGRKVVVPSTFSGKTHPNICFLGSRIAKKFYVINESINISEENDINVINCH